MFFGKKDFFLSKNKNSRFFYSEKQKMIQFFFKCRLEATVVIDHTDLISIFRTCNNSMDYTWILFSMTDSSALYEWLIYSVQTWVIIANTNSFINRNTETFKGWNWIKGTFAHPLTLNTEASIGCAIHESNGWANSHWNAEFYAVSLFF